MKKLILAVLLVLAVVRPAAAEPIDVTTGWCTEVGNREKGYDYGLWYTAASTKVGGVPIRVGFDRFSGDYQQLWLGAGSLQLLKTPDVHVTGQPTLVISNANTWFVGGVVNASFPKLDVTITQKSFFSGFGNKGGKHLTFATWAPKHSPVGLELYGFRLDHWYLGPTAKLGPTNLFVGKRLGAQGWTLDVSASVKF